eukprot:8624648-Pyramimonas_sp.AAC.1
MYEIAVGYLTFSSKIRLCLYEDMPDLVPDPGPEPRAAAARRRARRHRRRPRAVLPPGAAERP